MSHLYESICMIFPSIYVNNIDKLVSYSGSSKGKEFWIGKAFILSIFLIIIGSIVSLIFNIHILLIIVGSLLMILLGQFLSYLILYFKVDSRKNKIEEVLPDALQLIASNLQAGMTPFKAIKVAARKEFGPLANEFKEATEKALGMRNFSEELLKISNRVDSSPLERTLKLITSSLSSGGHLATLLEELSEDIAETRSLKNEMVTNTKTYTMFIMFTIIVGTPLLLAISIHFVDMVQNMQGTTTLSTDEFGLGFLAGELEIDSDFLNTMSLIILSVTSLLASMLTGTITNGEVTAGFKYAPGVVIGSIILFFISKIIIGGFFSGI